MFESILIANRGEIACRIARTCRRLGIRVIAVHSEADTRARHVREADQAVCIGPAEAARSYLDAEAIIRAALDTGAGAIHPGYGFLSENTQLVRRCAEHGIAWIGPNAGVIERMGSKIESKRIAAHTGVPCVPGYHGDNQDLAFLLEQAHGIGTPLLIKASAGGGGKGMRRVDDIADFPAQLQLARQEAMRAFGDDRVLIEKLIERPRHLEVQLAGDRHGNLIHLHERECSVQRNYQKVFEEAPAPRLPEPVRERLHAAALKLGREIGYDSLGTVEFVLGEGMDTPYFLEMNTRLQVEHPVTELVTGLDLVELQIRIAAGETLPLAQADVGVSGCAIEARINCENPAHGYQPEFGTVSRYAEPELPGIRIDSGIAKGSEITPHYDSMVAKVMGHGATRGQAADRLAQGLDAFEAAGIGTNQALLRAVVDHPLFRAGRLTTGFLGEAFPGGWHEDVAARRLARAAAALAALRPAAAATGFVDAWHRQSGYRFPAGEDRRAVASLQLTLDEEKTALNVARDGDGWHLQCAGEPPETITARWLAPDQLLLAPAHGLPRRYTVIRDGDGWIVNHQGSRWRYAVSSKLDALARSAQASASRNDEIHADMPGAITAIHVRPGDTVAEGDVLVVLEAMKLIFSLTASRAGTVAETGCSVGDIVTRGQMLARLEPLDETRRDPAQS
jgi:3-methylcrotonyl-CoA carboxylase alpha subunit